MKVSFLISKKIFEKEGGSNVIENVESAKRKQGDYFPHEVVELFLRSLCRSVQELYTIDGHTLDVTHSKDESGICVTAHCSGGTYAEWYIDSERNVFEVWDSWKREGEGNNEKEKASAVRD